VNLVGLQTVIVQPWESNFGHNIIQLNYITLGDLRVGLLFNQFE